MRECMVAGLVVAAALLLFSSTVRAERHVVINGQAMSVAQIVELERLACVQMQNGHYWLDTTTGVFGYVDNPRPQGRLRDSCNRPPRRSG